MFVLHVGHRDHRAVGQSGLAVHADVQSHAEVPLLDFAGLVHFGVSGFVRVLGRAGRVDDDADSTLKLRAGSSRPTRANRARLDLLSLSRRRNLSIVVASGTGSQPRAMPKKRCRLALSYRASLQARSARLNQCCRKWMRNMRSILMGTCPLPVFGWFGAISLHRDVQGTIA